MRISVVLSVDHSEPPFYLPASPNIVLIFRHYHLNNHRLIHFIEEIALAGCVNDLQWVQFLRHSDYCHNGIDGTLEFLYGAWSHNNQQ